MPTDFYDINYLNKGSEIQKRGFLELVKTNVLDLLKSYDPVLAGTLPLDLFIEGSDLDILCYAPELNLFESFVINQFATQHRFTIYRSPVNGIDSVISQFETSEFRYEIFGQPIPTRSQQAYQHLVIEEKILSIQGAVFRKQVVALKKAGLKTEPAFAQLLGLKGDPYAALLALKL